MNTYITLACLLAVATIGHGYGVGVSGLGGLGYGYGLATPVISAPILAPAAVSTANLVKAAPIPIIRTVSAPIIRTVSAPIITAPVIKTVAVASPAVTVGLGGLSGLGWGGYGLGGLGWGGYGLGKGVGLGWGKI